MGNRQDVNNFNTRVSAILIFLIILVLFCFLGSITILSGNVSNSFYWGMIIGIFPGIATWNHMKNTWDPKNLRPKDGKKKLDDKWIPFVVISGMFVARIFDRLLPVDVDHLITGFIVAWLFMTMGYMIIQAWKHR